MADSSISAPLSKRSVEPWHFLATGLVAGLASWRFATIELLPPIVFCVAMLSAFLSSGAGLRLSIQPPPTFRAILATVGIYWVVTYLLYHRFLQNLAYEGTIPEWLALGTCGAVGALGVGLVTAHLVRGISRPHLILITAAGALSALTVVHPIMLFVWWQTSVAGVIGLWVRAADGPDDARQIPDSAAGGAS